MILSAFISTLFGLFAKLAMATIYLPFMVFLRFFVPLLLVMPYFIRNFDEIKKIEFLSTRNHVLRAIAVLVSQYSLFYFFTKGSLTDGVLLWNTAPMFMPIITYIFFKHKTSKVVWLSLLVSFTGVICVLKPTGSVFDPFSIYGFVSGLAVAFSQVLYGLNRESDTLDQNLFLFFVYSSFFSFLILIASLSVVGFGSAFLDSFYTEGSFIPIISVFGVGIGTIFNQILRGKAYKCAKPASLAPYIYLSVVFAAFIEMIHQPSSFQGFNFIIGMLLIFIGTMIRIVHTAKA